MHCVDRSLSYPHSWLLTNLPNTSQLMLIKIVNAGDEMKRDDLDEVLYKLVEEAEADGLAPVQNESGVYELVGEVLGSLTEGSPAAGLIPVLQDSAESKLAKIESKAFQKLKGKMRKRIKKFRGRKGHATKVEPVEGGGEGQEITDGSSLSEKKEGRNEVIKLLLRREDLQRIIIVRVGGGWLGESREKAGRKAGRKQRESREVEVIVIDFWH